jgi:hypothetical protein
MAWPLSGASGSGPRAEQRESKLVGEVEKVCTKALQQRTGLVKAALQHQSIVNTARCPAQVSRILLDCIHGLVMAAVASNVMVLSSIKIGAPASSEGT